MLTPAGPARRENLALIEFDPDCRMAAGAVYAGQPAYLPSDECHAFAVVHLQLASEKTNCRHDNRRQQNDKAIFDQERQNPFQNKLNYISPGNPPTHMETGHSPCLLNTLPLQLVRPVLSSQLDSS
jgi:hypothetical protein